MTTFRTKARAVELLGKGQIADLPTAISELWKNGYDAYANTLGCDLYLPGYRDIDNPCFVLFDDGFGMDDTDIKEKWLTLGTDSKARGVKYISDEERFNIPTRIPMGEKGIGRLSVAYLGSPMLMLTKKKGKQAQMLLMDWLILENYNLYVDDINIPVYGFSSMDDAKLNLLIAQEEFAHNLDDDKSWEEQENIRKIVENRIKHLYLPEFICESYIRKFLDESYHGTTFIVFAPNEQLLELENTNKEDETDFVAEVKRSLSGIYNLFVGEPDFNVSFNIYNEGGYYNIINDFFNKHDLERADHYIAGHFDENGFFEGKVRVYDQNFDYKFHPIRVPGSTPYGPFDIELGVIERQSKTSMLNIDEYTQMSNKTERFGGLYIYRDNFRVLPYGRKDYDFLQFEARRSKRMGDYYFGYGNMFGYIAITRKNNYALTEKAGREGFVENRAYKEFKRDLIAFFVDIAKAYFSSSETDGSVRLEKARKLEKDNEKLIAAEKKKNQQTRAKFVAELKDYTWRIENLQQEIEQLHEQISIKANQVEVGYSEFLELSERLEEKKKDLRTLKLEKPKRASLTSRQEEKLETYNISYRMTGDTIQMCQSDIDRIRSRFDVQNMKNDYEKMLLRAQSDIVSLSGTFRNRTQKAIESIIDMFKEEQTGFVNEFRERISQKELITKADYSVAIEELRTVTDSVVNEVTDRYLPFVEHVENLSFDIDDDMLVDWYQRQNKKLTERMEMTNDLTQLGVSAEIIDHELNNYYSRMRSSMDVLEQMAKDNTDIRSIYNQLNVSFQHIESNYKMLQPLYHTRKKYASMFSGKSVYDNMQLFFANRLQGVTFICDDSFAEYQFNTYESVIVSVFINVINNALYWLTPVSDKQIKLEYNPSTDEILIMNNGEPIEDRILKDIFTLFFSRRTGGRGIGLYLAKHSLNGIGLDIYATNDKKYNKLNGACFVICKYNG